MIKLNIGSGRQTFSGFTNIDITQYIDKKGNEKVDIVMNIEKEKLPYEDNSVDEIKMDNVWEHLGEGFIFALNEAHRVLKPEGKLTGIVPLAGSEIDFGDITHKRHFNMKSFAYICGVNDAMKNRPNRPKYADYGVLPWNKIKVELDSERDLIFFELSPRKVCMQDQYYSNQVKYHRYHTTLKCGIEIVLLLMALPLIRQHPIPFLLVLIALITVIIHLLKKRKRKKCGCQHCIN
jgi:SAM-dependent methyltransferase